MFTAISKLTICLVAASATSAVSGVPSARPSRKDRTFSSPAINTLIEGLEPLFKVSLLVISTVTIF